MELIAILIIQCLYGYWIIRTADNEAKKEGE